MIPLANTGIERINRIEVIIIDQQNRLILIKFINFDFKIKIEIIKFIDLRIDEIPFKCKEIIMKLIHKLFCVIKGG